MSFHRNRNPKTPTVYASNNELLPMQFGFYFFFPLRGCYTALSSKPNNCHDITCVNLQKIVTDGLVECWSVIVLVSYNMTEYFSRVGKNTGKEASYEGLRTL